MFYQTLYEPGDLRIHATKSGFEALKYLKKSIKDAVIKVARKTQKQKLGKIKIFQKLKKANISSVA